MTAPEIPPTAEECVDGDPHASTPMDARIRGMVGRLRLVDGQLDFGFGRITPNVPKVGWLLFDGRSQTWQGLTLGAVPTGRYTHVEPCLESLRRLRAIEADLGPAPIRKE